MEQGNEEFREILSLVAQLKEGEISPVMFSRLDQMLSTDPAAREYYTEIVGLHADLEHLFKNHQK